MPRFLRGHERCDRIQSLARQSLAVEFCFAAGRGEAAVGEGQKRSVAYIEANVTFCFQPFSGNSLKPGCLAYRVQSSIDHLIHGLGETGIGKPHTLRQFLK